MFRAISRSVVAHPWRVLGVWIVAGTFVFVLFPTLASVTNPNQAAFLPRTYQSVQAMTVAAQNYPRISGASIILVATRRDREKLTPADQAAIGSIASRIESLQLPAVTTVVSSPLLVSPSGKVELVQINLSQPPGQAAVNTAVTTIRGQVLDLTKSTDLTVGTTGDAAVQVDSNKAFATAQTIIGIATILLIVILLGLIFRSPVIAFFPILVIGLVHQMASQLVASLAKILDFQVGVLLTPLLVVVIFGIGTDYIVFLLYRYRERMQDGYEARESLAYATERVGEVISSSALTVIAAFAALLLASLGSLKTLAPGLVVSVALMLAAALTLVPALLSILGRLAFWPSVPGRRPTATISGRMGRLVGRHPGAVILVYGGVLAVLAVFALGYRADYDQIGELPSSTPSVRAYDTMASAFPPGVLGPVYVFAQASKPLPQAGMSDLVGKLEATPGVAKVVPPEPNHNGTAQLVAVILRYNPYSSQALNTVKGPLEAAVRGSVPGAKVVVGGPTAIFVDVRTALARDLSIIFPVAALTILGILALLLRSLVAPFYLIVAVGIGFLATLGACVIVFQGAAAFVGLDFSIPIVLYLFVVAIGTDYNILITARTREELMRGASPSDSAVLAIKHGAPTVATAGIVLAGTFASLMLTDITTLLELGFGVAIGIVISAFVMAPRITPSIAALRGWRFWWPSEMHERTALSTRELVHLQGDRLQGDRL